MTTSVQPLDVQDCKLLNALAATYIEFGQLHKAHNTLQLSLAIDPRNADTLGLIAMTSVRTGRPKLALQALARVESISGRLSNFLSLMKARATRMF